jgi:uncharacterized membrane protein
MNERPKIKLDLKTTDRVLEILGWLSVLAIWILTLTSYQNLPQTVPIHYNFVGEADGFGDKTTILILPLFASLLFVAITILNKFPHAFNYPTTITKENALVQYTNATRLLRYLKFIIVFIFGLIYLQIVRDSNGLSNGLGIWFLPITLFLIFIPLIYFLVKAFSSTLP